MTLAVAATIALAGLSADAGAATWLRSPQIVVPADLQNQDCRTGVCKHNENTDLTRCGGSSSVTASTTRPPTRTAIRRSC